MSNYYRQYRKYINLRNQKGGEYNLDEKTYVDDLNPPIDESELKYIAGPVSYILIRNEEYDKTIRLFGDRHVFTSQFECGPAGIDDSTNQNTIYLPDYLKMYFNKYDKIPIDLFIEIHYMQDKIVPEMQYGLIENIRKKFLPCFKTLTDKVECNKIYPNIRFHIIDIRYYESENDTISNINVLNGYITQINYLLNDEDYLKNIIKRLDETIQQLFDEFTDTDSFNDLLVEYYDGDKNPVQIIDSILEFMLNNNEGTKYYKKILNIKSLFLKYHGRVIIDDYIFGIIKLYIGDENGIYADIDGRFWNLVRSSIKLNKNVGQIVFDNYEPDIYSGYWNITETDFIKEIMITKEISSLNVIKFQSFLLTVYGFALMDVYLLGRIFKKFVKNSGPDITPLVIDNAANNIFIIAGNNHIKKYKNFFKKINSTILQQFELDTDTSLNPSKRCIKYENI